MNNLLFIDSLSHPSVNEIKNQKTIERYHSIGVGSAIAVPNPFNDVLNEEFSYYANKSDFFHPVWLLTNKDKFKDQILLARKNNCIALKIHPRFLNWDWAQEDQYFLLSRIFKECEKFSLPIMFCTYYSSSVEIMPKQEPLNIFTKLLTDSPKIKLIFLHGGTVNLLNYIEFARFQENILIDLSYTLARYIDSSLKFDFIYAMEKFDKRICFGSDYPDLDIEDSYNVIFDLMKSINLQEESRQNILGKNLKNFLCL